MDFQAAKNLVREHHRAIADASAETIAQALERHTADDWHWRGMHPFHEQRGAAAVAKAFWSPYLTAMTRLQRRPDIFMAGLNQIDDFKSVWVVSMGHLMGLFDKPWLGIRPSGKISMMRYVEFNRVEDGRILETAMFFDIPQVMIQAGQNPFPPETGAHLVQPGPATHEGLMYGSQEPDTGQATLRAINAMLQDMGSTDRSRGIEGYAEELARTWNDDMIWWGPAGIGATYTIRRYIRQHSGPFRIALSKGYRFNGHLCRMAEGHFGGFFGWANLTLSNAGGYMGMTASPNPADMRVVDLYREENGKLSENWIFIDILHYLNMQGLDVLARMGELANPSFEG
ncbi:nuclear transport factor 2 family protein [Mesorhizobium sp. INR15]|uniref:nuclear transport factor 2 family protein n=1 Tax=Mesorhizobium sp. INR15 TaxID=2654248 RepID=UPI0018966947|nr:nuclear transport factor 2 family protein [Mesorhizobium sp. INR15]QPC95520.1 nuclear transport factor 2 family protein [Mesorhizobium sp. INR15]